MRRSWKERFGRIPADRLYLTYEACHAAAFGTILPLFAVYFRYAQLSLFDIALLAFVLEGTILLCEIPTGAAADLFGRVNFLRLASVLLFASGVVFTIGRSLSWFVAAEVLCGIGEACRSGSADAWISTVLQDEARQDELSRLFARRVKFSFGAAFLGMLIGGLIGQYLMAAGWLLFSLLSFAALLSALLMTEGRAGSRQSTGINLRSFFLHAAEGVKHTLTSRHLLAVVLLVLTANFAYEGVDQYWQVFLKETHDVAISLFGVATAITALVLFLIADRLVPWLYRQLGLPRPVYLLGITAVCGLLSFSAFSSLPLLLISFGVFSIAKNLQQPLIVTFMTENSPPSLRATILSTQNLFSSSGEMIAALSVGLVAAASGLRTVFLLGAILIVVGVFLFAAMFGRSR